MLYEPWMDVGFCANAAIAREHLLAGLLSAPVMILGVSPISHTVIRQSASFAQGCEKIDDRLAVGEVGLVTIRMVAMAVAKVDSGHQRERKSVGEGKRGAVREDLGGR